MKRLNDLSDAKVLNMIEAHKSLKAAAAALKIAPTTLTDRVRKIRAAKLDDDKPQKTISDFRREHDQSWKIRDGLKHLFAGGRYLTDAEFREAVKGNPSRWRAAADRAEFKDNRYRVQGETLWASADTILEMRRIRGEAV